MQPKDYSNYGLSQELLRLRTHSPELMVEAAQRLAASPPPPTEADVTVRATDGVTVDYQPIYSYAQDNGLSFNELSRVVREALFSEDARQARAAIAAQPAALKSEPVFDKMLAGLRECQRFISSRADDSWAWLNELLEEAEQCSIAAQPAEPRIIEIANDIKAAIEELADGRDFPDLLEAVDSLAALASTPAAPAEPVAWRCFHCDETFKTSDEAKVHFGPTEYSTPACQINAAEYREMEERMRRYNDEDADIHRQMYGMQGEHATALLREEEKGYARGLADAQKHPEELGLMLASPTDFGALHFALKGAANYIDVLGGISQKYRQVLAAADPGAQGAKVGLSDDARDAQPDMEKMSRMWDTLYRVHNRKAVQVTRADLEGYAASISRIGDAIAASQPPTTGEAGE